MGKVISKDGTAIAFDKLGEGSPLILVSGAFTVRLQPTIVQLAALLAPHFTVFNYDRRGRGESGDTPPYAVEREVEDLAALIKEAGGWAFVWGWSSGAALALEAAARGLAITRLAHTLIYDVTIMGGNNALPTERVASVTVPTLVIEGGASSAWMHHAALAVAEAIATVLEEFFIKTMP